MPSPFFLGGAAVAAVVALALAVGVACRSTGADAARPLPQTDLARGAVSGITETRLAVARDAGTWMALWAEHARLTLPPPPAPEVDFASDMVVAVFLGQRSTGGFGVTIEACLVTGGELRVRAAERAPDPDAMTTAALTAPFHAVVVPRAEGARVLELRYDDR